MGLGVPGTEKNFWDFWEMTAGRKMQIFAGKLQQFLYLEITQLLAKVISSGVTIELRNSMATVPE